MPDRVLYDDRGRYEPLRWSFPDLRGDTHAALFVRARQRYKQKLRAASGATEDDGRC